MDKEKVYTGMYIIEYYCHKEKTNAAICNNMNENWEHSAKWNKSDRERQTLYDLTCYWVDQKVRSGFCVRVYGNQMNFLANPINLKSSHHKKTSP